MKTINRLLLFAAFAAILTACGGNHKADNSPESDSALTVEQESPVAGDTLFCLTAEGIGPIRVGQEISEIPAAVPNLYDQMIVTDTPGAMAYSFLLGNVPQFTIFDFMEGRVDVIALEGNARGVATPEGQLRVGDEFTRVLALPGVTAEWQALDDAGIWYWRYAGLFIGVEETGLSEQFADALCDSHNPPRAALFTPAIKIGYIGTGLPF